MFGRGDGLIRTTVDSSNNLCTSSSPSYYDIEPSRSRNKRTRMSAAERLYKQELILQHNNAQWLRKRCNSGHILRPTLNSTAGSEIGDPDDTNKKTADTQIKMDSDKLQELSAKKEKESKRMKDLQKLFELVDSDHDGFVCLDDILQSLRHCGLASVSKEQESKVKFLFLQCPLCTRAHSRSAND